jgi:hypothetical protein
MRFFRRISSERGYPELVWVQLFLTDFVDFNFGDGSDEIG